MTSKLLPATWLEDYARKFAEFERSRREEIAALLAKGGRVVYEDFDSIFIATAEPVGDSAASSKEGQR